MPLIGNTSTFKLSFSLYIRKKLIEPMFETAVSLLLSIKNKKKNQGKYITQGLLSLQTTEINQTKLHLR